MMLANNANIVSIDKQWDDLEFQMSNFRCIIRKGAAVELELSDLGVLTICTRETSLSRH